MKKTYFCIGGIFVLACILVLNSCIGLDLFEHNCYDSYSLQAQAWLDGKCTIDGDYSYLELAQFEGKQYLSFPPFPSVFMLPFVLIFGQNTPSGLLAAILMLASYAAAYSLCRKQRLAEWKSCICAVFIVLGCNYAEYGLYGGVWNLAQSLAFLLTLLCFRLILSKDVRIMGLGLVCIACAVGCRPFQAYYALFAAVYCFLHLNRSVRRMLPILIVPLLIAAGYGTYNYVRFGNPLEFGHNYLPEFLYQSEHGQLSPQYILNNLKNIFRLPFFRNGRLEFPVAFGFAFWLCNPMYLLFLWRFVDKWIDKKHVSVTDGLLLLMLLCHFVSLLCHKSFGGVQFGTRYLCDLIPAMAFFWLGEVHHNPARFEYPFMAFGVAFNLYGAVMFHILIGG